LVEQSDCLTAVLKKLSMAASTVDQKDVSRDVALALWMVNKMAATRA